LRIAQFGLFVSFAVLAGAAQAQTQAPLQVSYPTDGALTCEQITAEVARMDGIIGVSNKSSADAQNGAAVANTGASVAVNGALYSGVLGRVPGLGLFANGAAALAQRQADAKKKEAEATIQTASTRRAMLMGMSQGKACGAPAPAAPAPAAAPSSR
jgi:hypothetical protein